MHGLIYKQYLIFISILVLGLTGCSNDNNPFGATNIGPLASGLSILPLKNGAVWYYDLTLSNGNASLGTSFTSEYYMGQFEMLVVDEQRYSNSATYLLQTKIRIDSIRYRKSEEYPYFDSVVVVPGEIDTTINYDIVFREDTLWYKTGDKLEIWLANNYPEVKSAEDKGVADLRIFSCPFFFDGYMPGNGPFWKTNFEIMEMPRFAYKKRDSGEFPKYYLYFFQKPNNTGNSGELRADFVKPLTQRTSTPGFISVKWYNHDGGDKTYSHQEINFKLKLFVPGE